MNSSAGRVLPTRVPNTAVAARSANGRVTSTSCGSMPCSRGRPPTGGSASAGFSRLSRAVAFAILDNGTARTRALFHAPCHPIDCRRLHVATELRPIRLHQSVRVTLVPVEAPADEQPLLADRHVAAGHHVARQAPDVAPVAQDGRASRKRSAPKVSERAARAQQGTQREGPPNETRRPHRPRRCIAPPLAAARLRRLGTGHGGCFTSRQGSMPVAVISTG